VVASTKRAPQLGYRLVVERLIVVSLPVKVVDLAVILLLDEDFLWVLIYRTISPPEGVDGLALDVAYHLQVFETDNLGPPFG